MTNMKAQMTMIETRVNLLRTYYAMDNANDENIYFNDDGEDNDDLRRSQR